MNAQPPFLNRVVTLAGGSVVAQGITVAAIPVLTRLYSPTEFGLLSVFASIVSFMVVIASFRYFIAIPLPDADEDARTLLRLSIVLNIVFSAIVGGACILFSAPLADFLDAPAFARYSWLVGPTILGAALYMTLSYWAIRTHAIRPLAQTKIGQSLTMVLVQLAAGLSGLGTLGLLLGDALGRMNGAWLLWRKSIRSKFKIFETIQPENLRQIAKRYRKFPLYSTPSALVNAGGLHAIPFVLAGTYSIELAGFFTVAQRAIGTPFLLVAKAVADVFLGDAARLAKDPQLFRSLYLKTLTRLALLASVPLLLLYFFGEQWIPPLLGEQWMQTATIAVSLVPLIWAQFAVVPLTQTLNILERQELQFIWDAIRLTVALAALIAPKMLGYNGLDAIRFYAVGVGVSYGLHIVLSLLAIRQHRVHTA